MDYFRGGRVGPRPGDVITVHEGVYRERIAPPVGGESNRNRILYRAAPSENVIIKGWLNVQNDTWKATIPNSFFGDFNPYSDLIHGDWFNSKGREHHTGAVYLSGHWLMEAARLDDVLKSIGGTPLWFGKVDETTTTIWEQFKDLNPNDAEVEINVRQTVFYPDKPGINYITARGFTMMHAATPWAPPTAEQIGLIGTHWSKGWIIENNDIRCSTCVGITLGKYGDQWDNTSQNSAEGYVKTIERALENGWYRGNIGHHIVRNNRIAHCEQAGIVGSLGAVFSFITGNVIHDNHSSQDLFVEVNHGPFLVDNNLFLSARSLLDWSQGGAYVHNLFTGRIVLRPELRRETPFHRAHSTEVAGLRNIQGGDDRFYNNIFISSDGLTPYDKAAQPVRMAGNVFVKGAHPSKHEHEPLVQPEFDPGVKLVEEKDGVYLHIMLDKTWAEKQSRQLVTTELLGHAKIPNLPYGQPDGSPYHIDTDYLSRKRNTANPFPGPFELPEGGKHVLKVWPVVTQQ